MSDEDYLQWENLLYKIALKYISKFSKYGYSVEDLVQICAISLLNAYNTFRDEGGASKKHYYRKCIEYDIFKQLKAIETDKRKANINNLSTFSPVVKDGDDSDNTIQDLLEDTIDIELEIEEEFIKAEILKDIKSVLSRREYNIFHLRAFEDYSFEDISKRYRCSSQNIRRIYANAKKKIYEKSTYIQNMFIHSRLDKLYEITDSSKMYKLKTEDYVLNKLCIEDKLTKKGGEKNVRKHKNKRAKRKSTKNI